MMRLTYSTTSPFVRKATAAAIELGLQDRLERVPSNPWSEQDPLPATNPLGKVPALTLEDGTVFAGSQLVCEYLDSLAVPPRLFPPAGPARFTALAQQSLADGILEAGVAWVIEKLRRPEAYRWDGWIARQRQKIERTLDRFEQDAAAARLNGPVTIGTLTLTIALDYLDFRFGELRWREGRPSLARWYEAMAQRPSLQATRPRESA